MSRRTYVELIDDIDPEEKATETVSFALDGADYEIDLNDPHAAQLREDFEAWVNHARRLPAVRRRGDHRGRSARSADGQPSPAAVRKWAEGKGIAVGARGRIPSEIVDQFLRDQVA